MFGLFAVVCAGVQWLAVWKGNSAVLFLDVALLVVAYFLGAEPLQFFLLVQVAVVLYALFAWWKKEK